MKRKSLIMILIIETVLLTVLVLLTKRLPDMFSSIAAFPFEQAADGLKALSGGGKLGSGLAAAVWIGLSAVPAIVALRTKRAPETLWERIALFALSGVLLLTLYGMVNPGLFRSPETAAIPNSEKTIKAVFGVSAWAFIILYLVLRLIRLFRTGEKAQLLRYLRGILGVLCVFFTGIGEISSVKGVFTLTEVPEGILDKGLYVLRLIASLVPYALDILVTVRALDLLDAAGTEDQEGLPEASERLSRIAGLSLGVTVALPALVDLIQILAMKRLTDVSITADLPLTSIFFVVMVLLFSRLLTENKRLRDESSLFI